MQGCWPCSLLLSGVGEVLETVAEFCGLLDAGGMVTRLGNLGLAVRCHEAGLSGL